MVGIVQLAEHWIVVPGVVGSSPITHPIKTEDTFWYPLFLYPQLWMIWYEMPQRKQSGGHFLYHQRRILDFGLVFVYNLIKDPVDEFVEGKL